MLLLDLDGVVYVGPQAVPGAPQALQRARDNGARLAFVTNNAARPPDVVARHLSELGVPAEAADVVTSAQAAAAMLSAELPGGARVLAIGGEGLRQALTDRGLTPVTSADDGPVAVVQGFAPETSWGMLLEACVAVNAGLPWVATNLDLTIPTPRGTAPGNGALVQVVRSTTSASPRVAGKPFRPLMDESCERMGAIRPLMVGDRLDTDIAGAHAAELPSLLVLTGVSGASDLLHATPELRPTYLSADLSGLHEAHVAPRRDGPSWVGASWRASWVSADDGPPGAMRLVVEHLPEATRTAFPDAGVLSGVKSSVVGEGMAARSPGLTAGSHAAGGSRFSGTPARTEASGSAWGNGMAGTGRAQPDEAVPGAGGAVAGADEAVAEFVDALRVVSAAVWDRVDAAADVEERDRIVAAGEQALQPWTTGRQSAG